MKVIACLFQSKIGALHSNFYGNLKKLLSPPFLNILDWSIKSLTQEIDQKNFCDPIHGKFCLYSKIASLLKSLGHGWKYTMPSVPGTLSLYFLQASCLWMGG